MSDARLRGWKEIADYLGVSKRSAQRAADSGLPVHRVSSEKGAGVFAFVADLDAWKLNVEADQEASADTVDGCAGTDQESPAISTGPIEPPPAGRPHRHSLIRWTAFAAALLATIAQTRLPAPGATKVLLPQSDKSVGGADATSRIVTHRRIILSLVDREGTRFTTAIPDGTLAPFTLSGEGIFGMVVRLLHGEVQLDITELDSKKLNAARATSLRGRFVLKRGVTTSLKSAGAAVDVSWVNVDEVKALEARPGSSDDRCCLLSDGFPLGVCGQRVTSPFGACTAMTVLRAR